MLYMNLYFYELKLQTKTIIDVTKKITNFFTKKMYRDYFY